MLFRTLAVPLVLALGLTGLTSGPASALVVSAQPAAASAESSLVRSASSVSDVPAKPKKAKKNTKTLVIMAYSKKKDAATPALLKKVFFDQLDRWMRWESAGRQGEKGTVTKWLKIASSTRCADQTTFTNRAIAAAKKAGYKPAKYQRIAIYFPRCSALPWAGLGTMGDIGDKSYQLWLNGSPYLEVVAHESLHNYGLIHSAAIDCGTKSLPKSTRKCTVNEYGDEFDIMGSTDLAMSASAKREVGWLTKKQSKTVKSGTKTFTIAATESASTALKLVRLDLGKGSYLDVEYRGRDGLDKALDDPKDDWSGQSGVQVRLVEPHQDFDDYARALVDVQPNNETNYASIVAGQSWTAPNKSRISVVSTDGGKAVVTVAFKAPAAKVPDAPSAPVLTATPAQNSYYSTAAVASFPPVSGNGMPVLEYTVEVANAAGTVSSTKLDARGGIVQSTNIGDLDYGSYQVRYSARNERGTGGFSAWSAPFVVTEPLPVIASINVENQTMPATFTWADLRAIVGPGAAGYPITSVYFSSPGSPAIDACAATLSAGSADQYECPYGYEGLTFTPGATTLTVTVSDERGHESTRTVGFTVANP